MMLYERENECVSCFLELSDVYILVSSISNYMLLVQKERQDVIETVYFEGEESDKKNLFSQCFLEKEGLIIVPESAEHLIIFNLGTKETHYINIPENYLWAIKKREHEYYLMGCKTGNLYLFNF